MFRLYACVFSRVGHVRGDCWLIRMRMGVFFFKQKTAYEMRISDWSSDVCSSDLNVSELTARTNDEGFETVFIEFLRTSRATDKDAIFVFSVGELGRASCRERVCQYV